MLKRYRIRKQLPKQDKHYAKWFSQNEHLLYRLDFMSAHEVVITAEYTDADFDKYGVGVIYELTKKLALKPSGLEFLNIKNHKTLAGSVIVYQKELYVVGMHNYAYIRNVVNDIML